MSRILIVLSAASAWTRADGSTYGSGVWAEEFVVMHETFVRAGCDVDIATPAGVQPTIDPLLADTLRKLGARYEKGKNWAPYIVKDGNLLSGQNPASTAPLADAVLAELV